MNLIHNTIMQLLPPFDSLVAFDAVLRHGSMTAAASELGVTQSAISHRLRRLEGFIGMPLLIRRRAGLVPTPAGAALAEGLGDVFRGMAGLRETCRRTAAPSRLRVGVGAAMANHWLVRRLPDFSRRHPGIEIELVIATTLAQMEARTRDCDVSVLWVKPEEARNSSTQRLLVREQVFPVCAPAVLKKVGARKLARDPRLLGQLPLLYKGTEEGNSPEWEWSTWFQRLGIPGKPKTSLRFADIGTAVSAALEGGGAVLARSLLVQDALKDGRLVRPLGQDWQLPCSKAHLLRWPASRSADLQLRAFVAWLAGQAEATITELDAGPPADSAPPPKLRAKKA